MTRAGCAATLVVALLGSLVCSAQAPVQRTFTLAEYRAVLQALLATARENHDLASAAASLPAAWTVDTGSERVVIPTEPVRRQMVSLGHNADRGARAQLDSSLQQRLSDLDRYEAARHNSNENRRRLSAILARREFSAVHGPTWLDRAKQAIVQFLFEMLGRVFGSSSFPVVASIFLYAVMLLAVLATAAWVYRALAGGPQPVVTGPVPVSAREWSAWLREAREAAAAGRWRDAVHLAYWAGISSLESQGVWPPDRARTPREYLRLLPPASAQRPALAAITRVFEPIWYGNRPAGPETFTEAVGALRELGCDSN